MLLMRLMLMNQMVKAQFILTCILSNTKLQHMSISEDEQKIFLKRQTSFQIQSINPWILFHYGGTKSNAIAKLSLNIQTFTMKAAQNILPLKSLHASKS